MQWEVFGEQARRIAKACARQCDVAEDEIEDCATGFLVRVSEKEDLNGPVWQGEKLNHLTAMAMTYARGQRIRLLHKAKREVSMTGPDGTMSSGPAAHLVSRLPGPEEEALRNVIREAVNAALKGLKPADRDLYWGYLEREERAVDLMEAQGRSASAIRMARSRLRNRLRKLLISSGMDHDVVAQLLNELDRLRGWN